MGGVRDTDINPLFNNACFSDVTIRQTCHGASREYYGHKAVLASQSRWFYNAFFGNFKEATAKVVELHDDNPVHFEMLLKCIYSRQYQPKRSQDIVGTYIVADKYACDEIKKSLMLAAEKKIEKAGWEKLCLLVELFYGGCGDTANSEIGRFLASTMTNSQSDSGLSFQTIVDTFKELSKRFPNFATDLIVHGVKVWNVIDYEPWEDPEDPEEFRREAALLIFD
ncbi:uncharacterized protein EI97DRAFT_465179 [Westerdykella ornata]|uniref:BTB domain-containing protein n=1 Tax=Westerdykella ornata TaxID=318751 RepID=A0A6A6JRM6_WESOR|nr:uncharacterized protein EI97DRAFT_465179 [Westerdykella ornata]KAF2278773.1 hypothetical protein EI97DRAFT_465179 [Westerdykella ornata]